MRKIAATYIFKENSHFLINSILILDLDGTVLEIKDTKGQLREEAGMEHHSGMLVPAHFKQYFEELKTMQTQNPDKKFSKLKDIKGFENGKKQEACLITGMDLENQKLLPSSMIKQLV